MIFIYHLLINLNSVFIDIKNDQNNKLKLKIVKIKDFNFSEKTKSKITF